METNERHETPADVAPLCVSSLESVQGQRAAVDRESTRSGTQTHGRRAHVDGRITGSS